VINRFQETIGGFLQRFVKLLQRDRNPHLSQTGHRIFADSAGNDAAEMAEIRVDIDRKAVHRHPFADADTDRANLRFPPVGRVAPDADPAIHRPCVHPKFCQRRYHPVFQCMDKAPHIRTAIPQVEYDIAHPLSGPVIGMAPPASGLVDGKCLAEQFGRIGAGARGIERRMFQQPDQFLRLTDLDSSVAPFHLFESGGIFNLFGRNPPFDVIGAVHRNFVHFCTSGGKGLQMRNGSGNEIMKLNYMQCWNGAMSLLGANKEAVLAIAGVFIFLPTLLFAQFVVPPVFTGEEDGNAMLAIYSAYFSENSFSIMASNLVISFGSLAIYLALAPSRNSTVAEDLVAALKLFLIYLLANLAIAFIVLPGFLLFIIPGLYLTARFILVPVVIVDQWERNPIEAIRKSWSLTSKNGFSILLFILIIAVVGMITVGVLEAVTGVVTGLATGGAGWPFIENLVAALAGTAFQLVIAAVITSIYVELTGRKTAVNEVFN